MVGTYDGQANFSLPFGGMVRALLPEGVVPAGSPLIGGLEMIGKKTFRAMRIPEGPSEPTFEHRLMETLGRMETMSLAQAGVIRELLENVGRLNTTVAEQATQIGEMTTEIRVFRRQRG
jgi:hypothetical protein